MQFEYGDIEYILWHEHYSEEGQNTSNSRSAGHCSLCVNAALPVLS